MMNKAKECESNNFNNNNNEVVSTEKETGRIWWYESASVISVCTSCISCGNFLGYTSSAVPSMIEDVDTFDYEKHYNAFMFIGGLGSLGALLGAVLSGIPLRFIGPRRTIALFGLPLLIASWVMIGLSQNITTVLVGRFLGNYFNGGVGVGAIICCAPLYVIDISSISNRGKMGVIPQFLMISGILISYILGAFFTWNSFALVTVFFSIVAMILISFAPDSPKWLILKNKGEEGLAILEKIHGTSAAKVIYKNIESSISSSSQQQLNSQGEKNNIWKNKATLKCILVCLGVISIQQLSGVNGITFFAATIFSQSSSSSSSEGHMPSIILAATQLVASFLSTFFVERFGRRFLLKLSSATLTISGGVLGAHFYWLVDLKELTWLPLVALIVFAFGFAIGLGPVTWIFVAEILPPQVRNVVNPLIIAYNWFCVFLITSSFPWLKDEIYYYGIFWLYATIAGVGFVFICLFVPETKGKSCDEIQMHFSGKDTIVVNNLQFSCS